MSKYISNNPFLDWEYELRKLDDEKQERFNYDHDEEIHYEPDYNQEGFNYDHDEEIHYEPEYNQETLLEYVSIGSHHKKDDHAWYNNTNVKDMQCLNEGIGLSKSKEVVDRREEITRSSKFRKTLEKKVPGHWINKGVIQGYPNTSDSSKPRTLFSRLINNNIVLPNAKVYYIKDQLRLAEGIITLEGIKCDCCGQVFTLSKFELHIGSSIHISYANIFMDDGRSLMKCQLQLRNHNKVKSLMEKKYEKRMRDNKNRNDYICSICLLDEEYLIPCDKCLSSYHTTCLGLKDVPDGDWFCPSCLCGYCGRIKFSEDAKENVNDNFLQCDQCRHKYHMECLKEMAHINPENAPMESCFCSKRCEEIFVGLKSRLGKCIPVGENLTWTLWKGIYPSDNLDKESVSCNELTNKEVESCNKLTDALNAMHECFEPLDNLESGRDIVEDVIFCRHSKLNRLNFEEFFTVILEENDELVSTAIVRIHGEKVAEMPFVATRCRYRKSGMCRILINEIEKMLMELGIQKIVLPSIHSALNIWKNSFGFSEMKNRESFLNYTFLDFEGTIMCQKSLLQTQLFPSSENEIKDCNIVSESNDIHLEANETNLDEDIRIMECKSLSNNVIPNQEVFHKDVYVVSSAELVKIYKRKCQFTDPKVKHVNNTRLF